VAEVEGLQRAAGKALGLDMDPLAPLDQDVPVGSGVGADVRGRAR
jgi:hypothetical protein